MSQTDRDIQFKVTDSQGKDIDLSMELRTREDLYKLRLTDKKHILCGFKATFLYDNDEEYIFEATDTVDKKTISLVPEELWKAHRYEAEKALFFRQSTNLKLKIFIKYIVILRKTA